MHNAALAIRFFVFLSLLAFIWLVSLSGNKTLLYYLKPCSLPATTNTGSDITYNLNDIIKSSGCEGREFGLEFSANSDTVQFSCYPRSTELPLKFCYQSIKPNTTYHFTFGDANGTENPIDVRSIPAVARDCDGQRIDLRFSGDSARVRSMCDNGGSGGTPLGYSYVSITDKKGHVTFTTK